MATDEIADRLYALPIEEFTRARNDAATELRKAGRRDEADEVKALRKPTAAAGAVNRLMREHRDEVEEYLAAAAALRDAQLAGKGDVAEATKHEREKLDRVLRLASGEVRQTLQAAAVDDAASARFSATRSRLPRNPSRRNPSRTTVLRAPSCVKRRQHSPPPGPMNGGRAGSGSRRKTVSRGQSRRSSRRSGSSSR
jgi:hypothetical protein